MIGVVMDVHKIAVRKVASNCIHMGTDETHRFMLLDGEGLAKAGVYAPAIVMGYYGIKLSGMVPDIRAVLDAVLWEDEHCMMCCGMLMRWLEMEPDVLLRCAPTITVTAGKANVIVERL